VPALDHLIVTAPSLQAGAEELEPRLGVSMATGGSHPGWGTHNALLGLGEGRYLELLAPDPAQPAPSEGRFLGLDERSPVRLATWAARAMDLDDVMRRARALGLDLGAPTEGSRRRGDGTLLRWRVLGAGAPRMGGLVPFFIDWSDSPHPSHALPDGVSLRTLRAEHPDPGPLRAALRGLDLEVEVAAGDRPALIAVLDGPRGAVTLR
jgi:hypothetical protein